MNLTAVTGLAHATVNHSVAFVAPNDVHTNGVENLWRCAKDKFKRMRGTSDELIASYLDEFLWHRMAGESVHAPSVHWNSSGNIIQYELVLLRAQNSLLRATPITDSTVRASRICIYPIF